MLSFICVMLGCLQFLLVLVLSRSSLSNQEKSPNSLKSSPGYEPTQEKEDCEEPGAPTVSENDADG